jgi:hypothetical protein
MIGTQQALTRRALVLPAAVLVLAVAAPIGVESAGASPSRPVPTPTTTPSRPHLPLHVELLGLQVSVDVPLTVPGLLHPTASPTSLPPVTPVPPVTPAPSTSVGPSSTRPAAPPTSRTVARPRTTHATTVVAAPVRARPSTSRPSPRPATSAATPAPRHQRPEVVEVAGAVLSALVPTSLARVLYLFTVLGALGLAALVIRMGRRGGHV